MEWINKLGFSTTVMLVGMVIVFVGLIILIYCIKFLSAVLDSKKDSKQESPKAAAPAAAPVVVPAPIAEAAAAQTGADANELIAVITAALMAYTADEKGAAAAAKGIVSTAGKTLVVRNIRAVAAKSNAWAHSGRVNQMNNRF